MSVKKNDIIQKYFHACTCLLVIGMTTVLHGQENFFSPLGLNKEVSKSYKHDFVSVIHGPGQIKFEMPLGPGIGMRGLFFRPKILIHLAQKTSSVQTGSCGYGVYSDCTGNDHLYTWVDGDGPVVLAYNANDIEPGSPVSGPSDQIISSGSQKRYDTWEIADFGQDTGTLTQVMATGRLTMVPNTTQCSIILPDGTECSTTNIAENRIDPNAYSNLLTQFGYIISNISTYGSTKSTNNGLLFSLLGQNELDVSIYQDSASPARGPGRYLLIKDDVAYEYDYFTYSQVPAPPEYDSCGMPTGTSRYWISGFGYRLTSMKNRFGDSILFSYGANNFDYEAELCANNLKTNRKVVGSLIFLNSNLNLPDAGAPTEVHSSIGNNAISISCTTIDNGATISSISIDGAIRSGMNSNYRNKNLPACPVYEVLNELIQPSLIRDQMSGYNIEIHYAWQHGTLPYLPSGLNVSAVAIDEIIFPGGESFKFTYEPMIYHATDDENADWEPMAWPVKSISHKDSSSGVERLTTYSRRVPIATNVILNPEDTQGNYIYQYDRQWINRDSYEAETLPDGRIVLRKFVPPQSSARIGAIALMNEPDRAKYESFYSGTLFEERVYSPGANWEPGVLVPDLQVLSVKFYDEWDASDNSKIDTHPYGVAPDPLVGKSIYSRYYPTRITSWNAATKIANIERKLKWDKPSSQWTEGHQISIPNVSDPWTSLELDVNRLSSSLAGRSETMTGFYGMVDRNVKTTFKTLDGYFNLGDWTEKNFFENSTTRLPSIYRMSNIKNGITISEETRAVDGIHIRKDYTYDTDTIGVPKKISLASDGQFGTDGTVGVNLGYDELFRLNKVQKLGAGYFSTRIINLDGTPNSITDINKFTYSYTWDSLGRLTSERRPNPEIGSTVVYSDDTSSFTITHGDQEEASFRNAFGEVIRATRKDTASHSSYKKFGYDPSGRKIWETIWLDGVGVNQGWDQSLPALGTQLAYDLYDRVINHVDPNGIQTTTNFQGLAKVITVAPGTTQSATTAYVYDVLNRLVKVVDALNQVTTYDYDSADRITAVHQYSTSSGVGKDAVGTGLVQTRNWIYDGLGRLVALDQPESGVTYYTNFDVIGNPANTVYGLPRGWRPATLSGTDSSAYSVAGVRAITSSFDTQGRLLSTDSNDGSINNVFRYDESSRGYSNGRLTTAVSGGVTKAIGYGGLNGRISDYNLYLSDQTSFIQSLTYNEYGNIKTRVYPSGQTQTNLYHSMMNLPNGTTFNNSSLVNISYDPVHWGMSSIAYSNSANSFFGYDRDQTRLLRMTHTQGVNTLKAWTYSYDPQGHILSDTEDWYGYDPLGRLTTILTRDLDPSTGKTNNSSSAIGQLIGYDSFGNRSNLDSKAVLNWPAGGAPPIPGSWVTTPTAKGSTYIFNTSDAALIGRNQLPGTTTTGAFTGAGYDVQGNLIRIYGALGDSSKQLSMTYDALGRVKTMADASRNIVEVYTYDDQGLRVLTEVYQGSVASQNLQKKQYRIYNEIRQLVSEYELVKE
ncbi:RHS repeat domain-containing protein [Geothrix terrae]|uniref:RHS repeat domain-containing protein n=1 Tax=Geothrix terrae TaxID=2922720 RepID=UPI001FADFDDA|nr:hypothetical protein [Geothrix terrae]